MQTRTERRTTVTLPALDEEYLAAVDTLDESRVEDFVFGDIEMRGLELSGTHLMDGRITGLVTQRATWRMLRVDSVEFTGCDLRSFYWADSRLTRVTFTDCKLLGASLESLTLDNVVFDNCRLDYATFGRVRAAGPAIFSRCNLREATLTATDLSGGLFDNCVLDQAEFDGGTFRGCDLRGNDLSTIRGVASLRQVVIDREQTTQLAAALATDLELTYGDDHDT